jgi:hypothetical protein
MMYQHAGIMALDGATSTLPSVTEVAVEAAVTSSTSSHNWWTSAAIWLGVSGALSLAGAYIWW